MNVAAPRPGGPFFCFLELGFTHLRRQVRAAVCSTCVWNDSLRSCRRGTAIIKRANPPNDLCHAHESRVSRRQQRRARRTLNGAFLERRSPSGRKANGGPIPATLWVSHSTLTRPQLRLVFERYIGEAKTRFPSSLCHQPMGIAQTRLRLRPATHDHPRGKRLGASYVHSPSSASGLETPRSPGSVPAKVSALAYSDAVLPTLSSLAERA